MMVSRRTRYERHLDSAKNAVEARLKVLKDKKLDEKRQKRDPLWRSLKAEVKKFTKRLKALDKVDAVNKDLEERRAARAAAPKEPKVKKKKPAPEAKAKGGGQKKEKKAAPAEG